jgi:uncharacterized protein (TIGR03435 family)
MLCRSIATIVLALSAVLSAQNPAPPQAAAVTPSPSFSVASVKENKSGRDAVTILPQPGGVHFVNLPLRQVILRAYQVQDSQLVGGPEWIETTRFDILAKSDGPPVPGQNPMMLRTLLADRFKLVVRIETRERPIYALVLARADGRLRPGLRTSTADCAAVNAALARGATPPQPQAGRSQCGGSARPGEIAMGGMSMAQLSSMLSQFLQRIVVDSTTLSGGYDINLTWAADGPPGADPANGASIFSAVQEQLGLKLEARQAPVPVVVIERIEHPTED